MSTTIESRPVKEKSERYGEFERKPLFDVVKYNGVQCGWRPSDPDDPNHKVLHPLSGVPQQVAELAVKKSGGKLTRTLKSPKPAEKPPAPGE